MRLGKPVLKAFNNINWKNLLNDGKPAGTPGRIALRVSGDDANAKAKLIRIIDEIGFDGVDAG
jgi:predicted dinucleotide-binding enzyme